jgi:PEGA domain
VPRGGGSTVVVAPRGGGRSYVSHGGRAYGYAPYRAYGYAPYRGYYPHYRSSFSVGFYAGYPFYGFGVGYGYPYAYGYPYYGYRYPYYGYGYPYGAYAYPAGYGYVGSVGYGGYASGGSGYPGEAYGGVRIENAPRDAQVFVDGHYAGIVDDFDGPFQQLTLESGPHQIEIRAPGLPPLSFDVNVQPGRTLSLHAR